MTVEIETPHASETAPTEWVPKARRQGERAQRIKVPPTAERDDAIAFAPPPVWPRVFPGI